MRMLDDHQSVAQWASESIKIPYKDPLTGKFSIYVPDFFIVYNDKTGKQHAEVIEVKPKNQTLREKVGKSRFNQEQYIKNMAKWEAAAAGFQPKRVRFRIVSEEEIFHQGAKRK